MSEGKESKLRWRKKYSLALLLWASGTALAFYTTASLNDYMWFAALLLGIFGTQDMGDNGSISQILTSVKPNVSKP